MKNHGVVNLSIRFHSFEDKKHRDTTYRIDMTFDDYKEFFQMLMDTDPDKLNKKRYRNIVESFEIEEILNDS